MPIAKISAKSDTRLIVKPQAQEAKSVAARVTMTAAPTTTASRLPTASNTRSTTDAVANKQLLDQLLRLVVRRDAVVARHRDLDAGGDRDALQLFDAADDGGGDVDGVAARLLRDRERSPRAPG